MQKKYFLLFLFLLLFSNLFSQECFEYHKTNCFPKKSKFIYKENISSVSFKFESGEMREIPFTFLYGKDYRITLCADEVFDNIIKIIIINKEGAELYNNSLHDYNLNLEFASKKTQNVIIEIFAPEPNVGISDTVYFEGCIGVLIEEMISVKTGF